MYTLICGSISVLFVWLQPSIFGFLVTRFVKLWAIILINDKYVLHSYPPPLSYSCSISSTFPSHINVWKKSVIGKDPFLGCILSHKGLNGYWFCLYSTCRTGFSNLIIDDCSFTMWIWQTIFSLWLYEPQQNWSSTTV